MLRTAPYVKHYINLLYVWIQNLVVHSVECGKYCYTYGIKIQSRKTQYPLFHFSSPVHDNCLQDYITEGNLLHKYIHKSRGGSRLNLTSVIWIRQATTWIMSTIFLKAIFQSNYTKKEIVAPCNRKNQLSSYNQRNKINSCTLITIDIITAERIFLFFQIWWAPNSVGPPAPENCLRPLTEGPAARSAPESCSPVISSLNYQ